MGERMGRALASLALGGVLQAACTLDVHGTMAPDGGDVAGQDAGVGITIPDASAPDTSVDPPDAAVVDAAPPEDHAPPPPTSCDPAAIIVEIPQKLPDNSGSVGTTGPACVRYKGDVPGGWGVSNGGGRMVTVIGASITGPFDAAGAQMQTPVTAGADGYVYWALTAGDVTYAAVYAF